MVPKILLSLVMVLSPLWPFGENPTPGAPFIIINKQTNQLAHIDDNKVQHIYPVATGATNSLTPEGLHTVLVKAINPYYRKKDIPGGDKKNPLGTRWIGFDAEDTDGRTYGIHGTNRPSSIGKNVSAGCIRMQNEMVEQLFEKVPVGTKVLIVTTGKDFWTLAIEYNAIKKS
ncbi:L,D-transpeptidase [Radiobacillus kanasensis]|uniref:L,D-transpeptidase n=1 Tax=Radiobacillus kanasensis TaxID=2844358 RepID=UPI001E3F32BE|nr:L,D-transpeptidase [Radiobacillus kanasensis]UFT97705.1 L,D-transpeptidase [Radiobacillus kanasensis]